MSEILSRLANALATKPLRLDPFRDLLEDLSAAADQQRNGVEPAWENLLAPHADLLAGKAETPGEIDSHVLMQGHRLVVINHQGEQYRLMETRNSKLILQK